MRRRLVVAFAICFSTAAAAANTIDGPVGRDAEKGDPTRWYRPADTPQLQHQNAMQEAAAALAEALKECRSAPKEERRQCEAEARSRHEDDVERARGFLVKSTLG